MGKIAVSEKLCKIQMEKKIKFGYKKVLGDFREVSKFQRTREGGGKSLVVNTNKIYEIELVRVNFSFNILVNTVILCKLWAQYLRYWKLLHSVSWSTLSRVPE